jgi:ubiquinone/menaquinone biosynthesis C-methylase UbiE
MIDSWEEGTNEEIRFWREWFPRKGFMYQGDRELIKLFDPMIGDKKEVKIANLGAGAINLIGNKKEGVEVTIIASDVLGDEYKQIWEELNIQSPIPIETQDMASLTYEDNSFDIVYCTNALDHCLDPRKAIEEMVRVCKPGGWIYLWHHAHEGKRLGYHGMHKWNLDVTGNGDCEFWLRNREKVFLLSEVYPRFTNTLKKGNRASYITSTAQKK